jgi:hypothetical protein
MANRYNKMFLGEHNTLFCIVLYLFQIPTDPYTGKRTGHKPQDIESVITIQYKMFQQRNL